MKTIIIGDVHGCLRELQDLLVKADYEAGLDRLIFVGDIINKGPDTLGVLNLVKNLNAEMVLGNHECALISRMIHQRINPRSSIERLVTEMGEQNALHWAQWLQQFPYYIEEDDFIVIHAGLQPSVELAEQNTRVMTTIRTWDGVGHDLNDSSHPPWWKLYTGKKIVVYGHWAMQGLKVEANSIGLDTGCVYGQQLTAVVMPEKKIVQVQAHKPHTPIR